MVSEIVCIFVGGYLSLWKDVVPFFPLWQLPGLGIRVLLALIELKGAPQGPPTFPCALLPELQKRRHQVFLCLILIW